MDQEAQASVAKGTFIVLALVLVSMAWYLAADRFTPYTQQARVQGFVVGVAPKVAGVVTRVWVKNDQLVEADQPLFQIDREQYEIAVERAQADLEKARSQFAAISSAVASQRANLRAAQANALKTRQDAERQERLYKEDPGAISVRRLEMAWASLESSRAKVVAAESEIQRALENAQAAEDQLKSLQSALQKAQLDLDNTLVKAPSAGVSVPANRRLPVRCPVSRTVVTGCVSRSVFR